MGYHQYDEDQKIQGIIKRFKDYIKIILEDHLDKNPPIKEEERVDERHMKAIIFLIGFFKHFGFHEEKECRLLLVDIENKYPLFLRKKGNKFISYTKFRLDHFQFQQSLKKIVIGPHHDRDNQKDYLENYLKQMGFEDTLVQSSNIPYIG